ncbi:MAG: hypothetical protein RLZZ271_1160 [Pseudomonadota bacterium]|jgi:phosphatidylglycerophosphate synthase
MSEPTNRRPVKSRASAWANAAATALIRTGVSPNQISVTSACFAGLGAWALMSTSNPWFLVSAIVCIQLRLICNLLDGMVAIEGGKKSAVGELYNEFPDRIADTLLLVAMGYHVSHPSWGWCAALLAALTAYVRVFGGSLGLPQDFRGPMAKQHRMAVLTLACMGGVVEAIAETGTQIAMTLGMIVILLGAAMTCITRTLGIVRLLEKK